MSESRPKLTRGLLKTLIQADGEELPLPIIVRYASERRVLRGGAQLQGLHRGHTYRLRPFEQMLATPRAIYQLEHEPDVERIFLDVPVQAFLDASVPHIQAPRLWDEGFTGNGVKIAVVDTGIDATHPDFDGRIIATADFTGEGDGDLNGHGTHCAGVAAGSGAASEGRYRGVAPAASLYIAKVLDATGNGMMSDVMAGVEWAVDQGVDVISLSLGSPGPCDGSDALSEICDAAVEAGIVMCVAAGNEGPTPYTVGSPGCARLVLTIGASDNVDKVALFSSRGPTRDGRQKPDVLLPGVDVIAPRATGTSMGTPVNERYTSASGTSMATPHAAGVCALLLEAEPNLAPGEVKQLLMDTAIDVGEDVYAQGCGRVDAWRALQREGRPSEPAPAPIPAPAPGAGCLMLLTHLWPKRRG